MEARQILKSLNSEGLLPRKQAKRDIYWELKQTGNPRIQWGADKRDQKIGLRSIPLQTESAFMPMGGNSVPHIKPNIGIRDGGYKVQKGYTDRRSMELGISKTAQINVFNELRNAFNDT